MTTWHIAVPAATVPKVQQLPQAQPAALAPKPSTQAPPVQLPAVSPRDIAAQVMSKLPTELPPEVAAPPPPSEPAAPELATDVVQTVTSVVEPVAEVIEPVVDTVLPAAPLEIADDVVIIQDVPTPTAPPPSVPPPPTGRSVQPIARQPNDTVAEPEQDQVVAAPASPVSTFTRRVGTGHPRQIAGGDSAPRTGSLLLSHTGSPGSAPALFSSLTPGSAWRALWRVANLPASSVSLPSLSPPG